ncbi:YeeE/YedE family protein [Rheinheimera mesophila]|uniref:YeeE/YedE family protein n=2 Tax=Rheinheimera mesophila TaxID=1547515 RepID=A0A3P3QGU6_9GAMM|nr:YeeE/YedE thiosulfate transporter family protein [Rheinheimera mesophila]KKK99882.1 YeeE/YedE [Rheinheimera mesophila]RRJ20364.1 YeeE/YedE family protein [Rheinheimera mesophila]
MMDWINFTPLQSLLGGLLIGLATAFLWLLNGRIAGISGITAGTFISFGPERLWRLAFVLGLILSSWVWLLFVPLPEVQVTGNYWLLAIAGLLVGFGARLGSGCTSGHGICGLSRLSGRSLVATVTFMTVAVVTVFVMRHVV